MGVHCNRTDPWDALRRDLLVPDWKWMGRNSCGCLTYLSSRKRFSVSNVLLRLFVVFLLIYWSGRKCLEVWLCLFLSSSLSAVAVVRGVCSTGSSSPRSSCSHTAADRPSTHTHAGLALSFITVMLMRGKMGSHGISNKINLVKGLTARFCRSICGWGLI